ncbi:MAG TPA: lysine 5,6-aminomutase subunit alpha [Clostridia bacterium]|nr:lysine 5,6-aminomutase subunit alpha [Clostridia bacterium]
MPQDVRSVQARESFGPLERVWELADSLAGAWAARARSTTTAGQERAILRLFGVHGLDGAGNPLAGAAVDRWLRSEGGARGGAIALPFAIALLEYDLGPQQLALDVAAGTIDLAMEAELLREPDRRAVAEAEANRLADAALERIDANRTARREILSLLGEPLRPWIGLTLAEPDVDGAIDEVERLVGVGADLLRVEVPVGRELADRMLDAGLEVPTWHPRHRPGQPGPNRGEPAPTGSQRGLAEIRTALDEAAAERRAYARLATASPALGSPEGAVVAAFERIDLTEANPMTEIVAHGVEPDRVLSDHVFANRLHRRAGTILSIPAAPLVVAPDLARGVPSDAPTRAGRTLALQALVAAVARHGGLPDETVVLGALPAWLFEEHAPGVRGLAEVALRRALFPDHPLAFEEPALPAERAGLWLSVVGACLPYAGETAFVAHRPADDPAATVRWARATAAVAAEVATATPARAIGGAALEHAQAIAAAALGTLERLADEGWTSVLGEPHRERGSRSGRATVIDRGDAFDPFLSRLGQPPALNG